MKLFRTIVLSSLFLVLFSSLAAAADYFDIAIPLYECEDPLTNEQFFATDPDCPAPLDDDTTRTGATNLLGYVIDPFAASPPVQAINVYQCYNPNSNPKQYYLDTSNSCPQSNDFVQYGVGPIGKILPSSSPNDQIMKQLVDPTFGGAALGWLHKSDGLPCDSGGPIFEGDLNGRTRTCTITGNHIMYVYNNVHGTFAPSKYYVDTLHLQSQADSTSTLVVRHVRTGVGGGGNTGGGGGNGEDDGGNGGTGGDGGSAPSREGAYGTRGNKPFGDDRGSPGQSGGSIEIIGDDFQNDGQLVLSGFPASGTGSADDGWERGRSGQGGSGGGAAGQLIVKTRSYSQSFSPGIVAVGGPGGRGGRGGNDKDFNGKGDGAGGGGGGGGDGGQLLFFDGAVSNPQVLSVVLVGGPRGSRGDGVGGAGNGQPGQPGDDGTTGTFSDFVENTYHACRDGFDNDFDGDIDFADNDCNATCTSGAFHYSIGCCGDSYSGTLTNEDDHSPRYAGDCGQIGNNGGSEVLCWADATYNPPAYRDPLKEPTINQWYVTDSISGPTYTKGTVVQLGCDVAPAVSTGSEWSVCNDPEGFDNGASAIERVTVQGEGHDYLCYKQDSQFRVSECHDGADFTKYPNPGEGITTTEQGEAIETLLNNPGFELGLRSTILDGDNVQVPYFWETIDYPDDHMVVQSDEARSGASSFYAEGARTTYQKVEAPRDGDYTASIYVKVLQPGAGSASGIATLSLEGIGQPCTASADPVVSGWQLIGCTLHDVDEGTGLTLELTTTGSDDIYFDDAALGMYVCGDDSTWQTDIHTDQVACDGDSEGAWTGSACCGERDDFQQDGFGETFNGGSGEAACFNGYLIEEGNWPVYEDGALKRASIGTQHSEIVNIDGTFRGCAIDEDNSSGQWQGSGTNLNEIFFGTVFEGEKAPDDALGGNYIHNNHQNPDIMTNDKLLDLVDCPNPGQDDCSTDRLIDDYGYCQTFQVGNEQVYCSYEEKWKKSFDLEPKDSLKTFPWTKLAYDEWRATHPNAPLYNETQQLECCGASQCWGGYGCVDSQHDTPQRDLFPDNYSCIQGEWIQQDPKLQWDSNPQRIGYCERETQCLVSVFGQAANSDLPSTYDPDTWGVPGQDTGPQCISAGQYIGDHYCEGIEDGNGNIVDARWSTRTKLLAGFFLQKVRVHPLFENQRAITDYSIYCDSYENALNNVDYYPVEKVNESPFVAGSTAELVYLQGLGTEYLGGGQPLRLCDNNPDKTCVNNFCVMRWDENGNNKTAFGVSLNADINTAGHGFLEALGEELTACDGLPAVDNFFECSGKFDDNQLWHNPVANMLVFSPEGITRPNHPQGNRILLWLAQYIPALEGWAGTIGARAGGVDYDFAGNVNSFNFFYEAGVSNDTGQIDKLVQVVKEEDVYSPSMGSAEDFLAARFTNFEGDLCATLGSIQLQTAPNAAYSCTTSGSSYEVIAHNSQQNSLIYDRWQDLTARLRIQKATPPCETDDVCNGYFNPLCPDGDPDFDASSGNSCCRIRDIDEFGKTVYYKNGELIPNYDGTASYAWIDSDCPVCAKNSDCNDNDPLTIDACEADENGDIACLNVNRYDLSYCSGDESDNECVDTTCNDVPTSIAYDVDCVSTGGLN